ncbi:AzlC family ABC transporter permease [Lachnobacterium bovis]|uniref:Predicted branched-chain amino acid permease (Azaleucine resistance) n=1 Tax=Lachnobacterium bovis TaxID=140626 RepID=A0A1H9P8T2_9FIRM|nr:AzlC family ABC transporter permease [Lachnobacterium bovis]SER44491.1 Predicted branched-chain amino acid permease (azaleucine resistance) [Lachnobacterium bovis]
MKNENVYWLKKGLKDAIPIGLGYFAVAFSLGVMAKNAKLSLLEAGFMSLGMVASAGEFAALQLIISKAGIVEMILTTIIVNLRYFLMGASLSQKISEKTKIRHRFFMSYCITDEIFGISSAIEGKVNPFYTYGAALMSIPGWTLGTVLGCVFVDIVPPLIVTSLTVAIYGMFLAIIIPASKKNINIAICVFFSMIISFLSDYIPIVNKMSQGTKVIVITIVIASVAAMIRPIEEDEKGEDDE